MLFKELDTVVVVTDLPALSLKQGDIGAVVHVHSSEAVEVEFVTASGHTQSVVTLETKLLRPVGPKDLLAVRKLDAA
jgi:hypothetical protein